MKSTTSDVDRPSFPQSTDRYSDLPLSYEAPTYMIDDPYAGGRKNSVTCSKIQSRPTDSFVSSAS